MPKRRDQFKALITADLHLSNGLPHAKPTRDGLTDRFEDQLRVLEQIKKVGISEKVDAMFILGDVFDKRLLDAVTLRHSLEAFAAMAPLDVWMLPGNHDAHSEVAERFVSEIFREGVTGLDHLHFLDCGVWRPGALPWLRFWALPYSSLDVARQRLATFRDEIGKHPENDAREILLMHQSVVGSEHLGWTCDAGLTATEVTDGFDHVFAGHFHKQQEFYVGAPMQLHFGEEGYPSEVHVVTFEKNASELFDLQSFSIKAPKFYTRTNPAKISKEIESGDYLKIQIKATHAEWAKIQAAWKVREAELKEQGVHAKVVHIPIYHHEARLAEKDSEVGDMPGMISSYVDAAEVVTEGAGKGTLKKLGLEILEEARASRGGVS